MSHNNPVAVAMMKRYGKTTTSMKDRRSPRGGARNHMADMLSELETDEQLTGSDVDSDHEGD